MVYLSVAMFGADLDPIQARITSGTAV